MYCKNDIPQNKGLNTEQKKESKLADWRTHLKWDHKHNEQDRESHIWDEHIFCTVEKEIRICFIYFRIMWKNKNIKAKAA